MAQWSHKQSIDARPGTDQTATEIHDGTECRVRHETNVYHSNARELQCDSGLMLKTALEPGNFGSALMRQKQMCAVKVAHFVLLLRPVLPSPVLGQPGTHLPVQKHVQLQAWGPDQAE